MRGTRWEDPSFVKKLTDDLTAALNLPRPAPDALGEYRWVLADRVWTTRAFIDPLGKRQTPWRPGIYLDDDAVPHVNMPELLRLFEIEDTPRNHWAVASIVNAVLLKEGFTQRTRRRYQRG